MAATDTVEFSDVTASIHGDRGGRGGGTSQHSTRDLIEKVYLVDNFSQTIRLDDVFDYAMFIVSLIGRPGILQRCGGGAIK